MDKKDRPTTLTVSFLDDQFHLKCGETAFSTDDVQDMAKVLAGLRIPYEWIEKALVGIGSGDRASVTVDMSGIVKY